MRLGTLAYQIIFKGESLSSYERKVAALAINGVDVGTTHHSKNFSINFIDPLKETISEKLKNLVKSPLPCSEEAPPFSLIDDKSRI